MKKKQEDEPIIEDKAKKVEEPKKEKKTRAKKSEEIKETTWTGTQLRTPSRCRNCTHHSRRSG